MLWLLNEAARVPFRAMRQFAPGVKLSYMVVFMSPMLIVLAGMMLVLGDDFLELMFPDGDSNAGFTNFAGVLVFMLIVCGAGAPWLTSKKVDSLGYGSPNYGFQENRRGGENAVSASSVIAHDIKT